MPTEEIQKLEYEIMQMTQKLHELQKNAPREEVKNYSFKTLEGPVELKDLFAGRDKLLVIHNMGQGCRYCTLWADGINAFLPHLESVLSVVLASKDDPETQRKMAGSRNWRFRTVSHGGGEYMKEQTVMEEHDNIPGAALYEMENGKIYRKNTAIFGPNDLYCSIWHILGLAGIGEESWTPQFGYWIKPEKLDDGGKDVLVA